MSRIIRPKFQVPWRIQLPCEFLNFVLVRFVKLLSPLFISAHPPSGNVIFNVGFVWLVGYWIWICIRIIWLDDVAVLIGWTIRTGCLGVGSALTSLESCWGMHSTKPNASSSYTGSVFFNNLFDLIIGCGHDIMYNSHYSQPHVRVSSDHH